MQPAETRGNLTLVNRVLLQLLALLPIPIIVVLVVWAAREPHEQQLVLEGHHDHGHASGAATRSGDESIRLPRQTEQGWELHGEVQRYDKDTLFDRINGAAPAYFRAGFRHSLGAEYKKPQLDDPVMVDVYDMGSPARALGMYATERDLSYDFLDVGEEGYLAAGSLNFWKGRFYVKLAGFGEGEAVDRALEQLARSLSEALPANAESAREPLQQLEILPEDKQIPHSQGYSHPELADIAGLAGVFYADYRHGEESRLRLFVARTEGAEAARQRLADLRGYFDKDGAAIDTREVGGSEAVVAEGEQATTFALARGDLFLGAVELVETQMLDEAISLWEEALEADSPAKAP
jgi:hypothetical protein